MKSMEQKLQEEIQSIRHNGFLSYCKLFGIIPTPYLEECFIERKGEFYISPEKEQEMLDILSYSESPLSQIYGSYG